MNGKPAFHPEMHSTRVDPLHETTEDFPYEEVERNLGEPVDARGEEMARLVQAVNALIRYLVPAEPKRPTHAAHIGRRTLAMAWVLQPGLVGGKSLRQLARAMGCTPQSLSTHAAEFSRMFNVVNRGQAHGWNRKKSVPEQKPLTRPSQQKAA